MVAPKSRKKTISIDYPEVCSEWDYAKNNGLTPEMFSSGSNKEVWWVCKNGHEWKTSIAKRIKRGQGCPFCSGHRVKEGFNDLTTINPSIAAEWHPKKNGELYPTMVTAGSNKKVWWLCSKCGFEWEAKVVNRINGRGCPSCGAKKRVSNYRATISSKRGTLEELAPEFLSEWDAVKNAGLTPKTITVGSNTKIWWLCNQGHSWQSTVYDRMKGARCPVCYKQHRTSLAEQAIFYYVHKKYEDAENGFTGFFRNSMELDIYIPSIKVGIEYDGAAWHNSEEALLREKKKYEICKKEGVRLYRIKENPDHDGKDTCDVIYYTKETIDDTIKQFITDNLVFEDIDVARDKNEILEQYKGILSEHSLQEDFPDIAMEWHPIKNGDLLPLMFASKSGQKVWWRCEKGHEWYASIAQRTSGNRSCPYCSNQKVLSGYNDLETLCPEIVEQWHPTKNLPLLPKDVTPGSGKMVWWTCPEGHEWRASVKSRIKGSGCPVCAGKTPIAGINDLATLFPEVAAEWDYKRNGELTPQDISAHSGKKVWWVCKNHHEWMASVDNRVKRSRLSFLQQ